jgi:hypothetical protein
MQFHESPSAAFGLLPHDARSIRPGDCARSIEHRRDEGATACVSDAVVSNVADAQRQNVARVKVAAVNPDLGLAADGREARQGDSTDPAATRP